jgi:hypothetical protein
MSPYTGTARRKVAAMGKALDHLRSALSELQGVRVSVDQAELAVRDAPADKREHMLDYLHKLDMALSSARLRMSVAVAEAAHLTVEQKDLRK